tara:strand:- start:1808 stop:2083 length:276 start_codon:yes stop_codon:yes gene_type:complete
MSNNPTNKGSSAQRVEPALELRRALYDLVDQHVDDDRTPGEIMLCLATLCIVNGMDPKHAVEAFNEVYADVYRSLNHLTMNPLAQVVREEA